MANCEMCGTDKPLFKTSIEGTEMNLCTNCSKFGKVIKKIHTVTPKEVKKEQKTFLKSREPEKEIIQVIVSDYADVIKHKREKLGLKQIEFAKKISEKESIIHKIEVGHFEPSIALARKIERFLNVKLIDQHEELKGKMVKTDSEKFTIGDFVKVRKK